MTTRSTRLDNCIGLYYGAIRDGAVRASVERFMGATYTQHSTGVPDGREGFIAFFEDFGRRHPEREIEVRRALVDGSMVFLHVFQSLDDGEAQWVTADFFETDDEGRLVEHWDVISPYAVSTPSGHTSIDGPTEVEDRHLTNENKAVVREMIEQVLIPGGDPHRVDEWIDDVYIQHSAEVPDGLAHFKAHAVAPDKPLLYQEIVLLVGEGNFVATLCRATWGDAPVAQVDLFRLKDGKIVEHWDTSEMVTESTVNPGKF